MSHTSEWKTHLYLFEEGHTTKVRVELDTGTTRLTGHGTARCNPTDKEVPEIGDELAAHGSAGHPAGPAAAPAPGPRAVSTAAPAINRARTSP
ncbi:dsRBD fold-containing protein [Streptomyces katrae]|uniref:dsRBD fold-containing protein n=1 Tax=Streptomyces TaxID=1883 RepID=UPI0024A043CE|nr:hypothetical protein Slala01_02640 [Streptomyces lavendulae subsp. lavendulae]GLX25241.1 hypothetical protein Slala02_10610 [Streptomyces lavendulae subsp. lavendulae]